MYNFLVLVLMMSLLNAEDIQVEKVILPSTKIEYVHNFTKEEISALGLNPEVITCFTQAVVVLPTGDRILYTTTQTKNDAHGSDIVFKSVFYYNITITATALPTKEKGK